MSDGEGWEFSRHILKKFGLFSPGGQTGAATIMVAERGAAAMLGSGADRCNAGQADSRVPVSA